MPVEKLEIDISVKSNIKPSLDKVKDDIVGFNKRIKSETAVNLSINSAKIKQQLDSVAKQIREAKKSGDLEAEIKLTADSKILRNQLTQADRELRNFARTGKKDVSVLGKLFDSVNDEIKETRFELKKLGANTKGIDILEKKLTQGKISAEKFRKELKNTVEQARKGGSAFSGMGEGLKTAIKGFVLFTVVQKFKDTLLGASRAAIEFESAFAGVRKTLDATENDFVRIEKGLVNLSKRIPITVTELSRIAEVGGQLGVAADDILNFTETVSKIGVATNLTAEEAATSFARISQVIGEPISNISNMASAVVGLGNNFATTESEILDFATRIAGAGKIVGLTSADIFGIAAAFSAVGIQAEAGGTAVQKSLLVINEAVLNGGKELEKFASLTGKTTEEFSKAWKDDAGKAFTEFVNGLGEAGDDSVKILQDLIGTDVRLARAFLSVSGAGDLLNNTIEQSNVEFELNNALLEEANKRFATNESRLIVTNNKWKALSATVGSSLNNVFIPLFEKFTDFFTFELPSAITLAVAALRDFAVIIVPNIFKNIVTVTGNLATNIGIAFGNIPELAKTGLNNFLEILSGTVNKAIGILNKIPEVNIEPVSFEGFGPQSLKGFKDLSDGIVKIQTGLENGITAQTTKRIKGEIKAREGFANERKKQIKEEISEEQKKNQELLDLISGEDGKTTKANKKAAEESLKIAEKQRLAEGKAYNLFLKKRQERTEDARDELEKTYEEEPKAFDKLIELGKKSAKLITDFAKNLKNEISGITSEIEDVSKNIEEINDKQTKDLGERAVEVQKEIEKLKDEGTLSTDKYKELKKLQEELVLINENTTIQQREQAEILSEQSEAEKILVESQKEKNKLLKEQGVLQEQKDILKSIQGGGDITTEQDGDIVRAFFTDEAGQLKEIQNLKNIQFAQDLQDKKQNLEEQLEEIRIDFENQLDVLKEHDANRREIESKYTEFLITEADKRKKVVDSLIDKMKELQAIGGSLGGSTSDINSGSTNSTSNSTDNSSVNVNLGGVNVNNNTDVQVLADTIARILTTQKKTNQ